MARTIGRYAVPKLDRVMRARILIVDEDPAARLGLAQMLAPEDDLSVCCQVGDAGDALALLRSRSPDLMLIDISLQGLCGLELIRRVHVCDPHRRILVCSMHDERLFAGRALRAGAMGYVRKEEVVGTLIFAIRRVLAGRVYLSPEMTDRMLALVAGASEPVGALELLSDRELEVFSLLGKGMTTRRIAEVLHLSPKTVGTHREHIKLKLDLRNNNELIYRAVEWAVHER